MSTKPTILIIDPSALVQRLICARLSEMNVATLCACTAEDGLRVIRDQVIDLVLCEVNLPLMSGFEFCESLREDARTSDIPLIFMTGIGEQIDKLRGYELGVLDFITKPPDFVELRMRVRIALRMRAMIRELSQQARTDALTGLHNRRYFDERLSGEMSAAQRYGRDAALLMIDIDHFKQVNDTLGHARGDEVLRRFGRVLKSFFRSSDVVCRFGGEEFAVIIRECTIDRAEQTAKRLLETIRQDQVLASFADRPITASIGVAVAESSGEDCAGALIDRADHALYRAKNNGRNQVVRFTDETSSASIIHVDRVQMPKRRRATESDSQSLAS